MAELYITLIFISIFAFIQIPITMMVGAYRAQTNILFLDEGDKKLLKRMRAHANFTETVPITLLAMAAAELAGTPDWVLWAGGATLLIGRAMHYWIIITKGGGVMRPLGMVLTFIAMGGFPIATLIALA